MKMETAPHRELVNDPDLNLIDLHDTVLLRAAVAFLIDL
jgi:hypothetical protein